MKIATYIPFILGTAMSLSTIVSCVQKDDWETPPFNCTNKFGEPNIAMADLKAQAPGNGYTLISTDQIFDAYVVSSDESGNFYKTISFQDKPENPTAGLQIEIDKSSNYADFPVGAHIRINAKGLRLGTDRGVVKIGSVDNTYAIGRIPAVLASRYLSGVCNGSGLEVVSISPKLLNNLSEAKSEAYINTLVKVPNTQFATGEIYPVTKTYLDYLSGEAQDTDRTLEDGAGNSVIIRNSAFFSEGSSPLPKGNGSATFVVSRYNTAYQMLIRNAQDLELSGARVDATPPKGGSAIAYSGAFLENFESYTTTNQEDFPKYINDPFIGNRYWQLKSFGSNKYIQLSANAGNGSYVTYFVVPVDFTTANQLKFDINIGYYKGNPLKVYTSTDYTPLGDISTATKTDISSAFTVPTTPVNAYGVFGPAGTYNFPAGLTGNGFVIFEYTGNATGVTTTIQLDNIQVL